jgi:hypothetical protein
VRPKCRDGAQDRGPYRRTNGTELGGPVEGLGDLPRAVSPGRGEGGSSSSSAPPDAELIQSLDEGEDAAEEVEAAWADEIQQRLADVDAGVVTPIPWPEARRRIVAAANGRR